jgi:hypothetical protein
MEPSADYSKLTGLHPSASIVAWLAFGEKVKIEVLQKSETLS